MFEFKDLDILPKLLLLKELEEAKRYYHSVRHLQALWDGFGAQAKTLYEVTRNASPKSSALAPLDNILATKRVTSTKLSKHLEEVDLYLRDINARLGDGTKWYTAQDIANMQEPIQEAENEQTSLR